MAPPRTIADDLSDQNAELVRVVVESPYMLQLDEAVVAGDRQRMRALAAALRNQLGRHSSTRDEPQRPLLELGRLIADEEKNYLPLALQLREFVFGLLMRHPRLRNCGIN